MKIGRSSIGTESASTTTTGGASDANAAIFALTTLTGPTTLKMVCGNNGVVDSSVFDIAIVAVSVGTATIGCPNTGSNSCP
jgi:hypothetical protein